MLANHFDPNHKEFVVRLLHISHHLFLSYNLTMKITTTTISKRTQTKKIVEKEVFHTQMYPYDELYSFQLMVDIQLKLQKQIYLLSLK